MKTSVAILRTQDRQHKRYGYRGREGRTGLFLKLQKSRALDKAPALEDYMVQSPPALPGHMDKHTSMVPSAAEMRACPAASQPES